MTYSEILTAVQQGKSFSNEVANWFTMIRPNENLYMIVIGERNVFFKNAQSCARKIKSLMNKGA